MCDYYTEKPELTTVMRESKRERDSLHSNKT